jgi:hypothetical protein
MKTLSLASTALVPTTSTGDRRYSGRSFRLKHFLRSLRFFALSFFLRAGNSRGSCRV